MRDQLTALETHVLGAKKEFNRLNTELKVKKRALSQSIEVLNVKDLDVEEKLLMEQKVSDLKRNISATLLKTQQEEVETCKLNHMKLQRSEQNLRCLRPFKELKAKFETISANLEAKKQEIQLIETQNRVFIMEFSSEKQRLEEKRRKNADLLEAKAKEYKDRKEFEEFCRRYEEQKQIFSSILTNESDLRLINDKFLDNETRKATYLSFLTSEDTAKTQEKVLTKLRGAANVYEVEEIVEHWGQLQTTSAYLQRTIEEQMEKVGEMKGRLMQLKAVYGEVKWGREPVRTPPMTVLEGAESRIKANSDNLNAKQMHLAAWQSHITQVVETLTQLCPGSEGLSVPELCERVATRVQSFLSPSR